MSSHDAISRILKFQIIERRSHNSTFWLFTTHIKVGSFLASFILTPFLGKRIATDENFRAVVPSWYDFSLSKPASAWTRQELHEQLVEVQKDLHERAIRGEFSPEKLESMRRHFAGVDPDDDEHGWGRLHPGVDDDEDVED